MLGQKFLYRRNSTFVDGVASDARFVAAHVMMRRMTARAQSADVTEKSMSTANTQHYDVIIAGARCAGAATALLLARQGARVLVLDKSRYGTDTLSTHALMRGAVLQLHLWGLLPAVAGGNPARSVYYLSSRRCRDNHPGQAQARCRGAVRPGAGASWTRSWPTPRAAPARTCGSAPRSPACGGTGPGG